MLFLWFVYFQAHPGCYRLLPPECNFGSLREIMLPPSCLTMPRMDLSVETMMGMAKRTSKSPPLPPSPTYPPGDHVTPSCLNMPRMDLSVETMMGIAKRTSKSPPLHPSPTYPPPPPPRRSCYPQLSQHAQDGPECLNHDGHG